MGVFSDGIDEAAAKIACRAVDNPDVAPEAIGEFLTAYGWKHTDGLWQHALAGSREWRATPWRGVLPSSAGDPAGGLASARQPGARRNLSFPRWHRLPNSSAWTRGTRRTVYWGGPASNDFHAAAANLCHRIRERVSTRSQPIRWSPPSAFHIACAARSRASASSRL
jgi:hypothetical protein